MNATAENTVECEAVLLTPAGEFRGIDLNPERQSASIREHVGGLVTTGVYHRRAVLHLLDDGLGEALNLPAWALASVWRGITLYPLNGPALITGPYDDFSGSWGPLDEDLAQQARTAVSTVQETVRSWARRAPTSNEAAAQELFAYLRRDLAAGPQD